jgi:hypothetical protein
LTVREGGAELPRGNLSSEQPQIPSSAPATRGILKRDRSDF